MTRVCSDFLGLRKEQSKFQIRCIYISLFRTRRRSTEKNYTISYVNKYQCFRFREVRYSLLGLYVEFKEWNSCCFFAISFNDLLLLQCKVSSDETDLMPVAWQEATDHGAAIEIGPQRRNKRRREFGFRWNSHFWWVSALSALSELQRTVFKTYENNIFSYLISDFKIFFLADWWLHLLVLKTGVHAWANSVLFF